MAGGRCDGVCGQCDGVCTFVCDDSGDGWMRGLYGRVNSLCGTNNDGCCDCVMYAADEVMYKVVGVTDTSRIG